uniref:Protein kinase domain-containing protein n=1 Tax=Rhabditophanes sp. KR3021 TaxID=114890 RepID=A0AC35TGQ7_9BILA
MDAKENKISKHTYDQGTTDRYRLFKLTIKTHPVEEEKFGVAVAIIKSYCESCWNGIDVYDSIKLMILKARSLFNKKKSPSMKDVKECVDILLILASRSKNYTCLAVFSKIIDDQELRGVAYLYKSFGRFFVENGLSDALSELLNVADKYLKKEVFLAVKEELLKDPQVPPPVVGSARKRSRGESIGMIVEESTDVAVEGSIDSVMEESAAESSVAPPPNGEFTMYNDTTMGMTKTQIYQDESCVSPIKKKIALEGSVEKERDYSTIQEVTEHSGVADVMESTQLVDGGNQMATPTQVFDDWGDDVQEPSTEGRQTSVAGKLSTSSASFVIPQMPTMLYKSLDSTTGTYVSNTSTVANEKVAGSKSSEDFGHDISELDATQEASSTSKAQGIPQEKPPRLSMMASSTPCRNGQTIPLEECSFYNEVSAIEGGLFNQSKDTSSKEGEEKSSIMEQSGQIFDDKAETLKSTVAVKIAEAGGKVCNKSSNSIKENGKIGPDFFNSVSDIPQTEDSFDLFAAVDNDDLGHTIHENRRKSIVFASMKNLMGDVSAADSTQDRSSLFGSSNSVKTPMTGISGTDETLIGEVIRHKSIGDEDQIANQIREEPAKMETEEASGVEDIVMQEMSAKDCIEMIDQEEKVEQLTSVDGELPKRCSIESGNLAESIAPASVSFFTSPNTSLEVEDTSELPHDCSINPWDQKLRDKMTVLDNFDDKVCVVNDARSALKVNDTLDVDGQTFNVTTLIATGGFAKVFKIQSGSKVLAAKVQSPPYLYETYICEQIKKRSPESCRHYFMVVDKTLKFGGMTVILNEYHGYGTLLDMVNKYRADNMSVPCHIAAYFALQMIEILKVVNDCSIIHADSKPDNWLITMQPTYGGPDTYLEGKPIIKLIDFGRSIDLYHLKNVVCRGKAATDCFDCVEMLENRPWTYQTDQFGFISTIMLLLTGKYENVQKESGNGSYKFPITFMKRTNPLLTLWKKLIEKLLNIPDCYSIPKWESISNMIKEELTDLIEDDELLAKQHFEKLIKKLTN